jgi:hypothetical protein
MWTPDRFARAAAGESVTGIAAAHPLRRCRRTAAGIIATAALVLLAAACSSGSPSSAGTGGSPDAAGSSSSPSAVAYSACMRSHGVPKFPDPGSSGVLPKTGAQQLGVSSSQLQVAQQTCQPLYPNNGGSFQQQTDQCIAAGDCPQALVQRILTVQRNYARCMRSHGFPNWPDPTIDSRGRPFFDISKAGISEADTRSSQWTSSDRECERLVGIGGDVPVDLG